MNCAAFEQDIALYVEGDLRDSERMRVEAHLEGCGNCRNVIDELCESQAVFKSLRQNAVNSAALAEVRQRVMVEVGDLDPAPAWVLMMHRLIFAGLRRRTAIAGIALAALVSGSVWFEEARVVSERKSEAPVAVARFEAPSPFVPLVVARPSAEVPRNVKREPVEVSDPMPVEPRAVLSIVESDPHESQVSQIPMKFVTDDPDIIIYWLPSDKGD